MNNQPTTATGVHCAYCPHEPLMGIDRPNAPARDAKISQCKICGYGVFRRQEHRWQNGSTPGLVHARPEDCGV